MYREKEDNIGIESIDKINENLEIQIKGNIISFYIIDKSSYNIKLFLNFEENTLPENKYFFGFLKKFIKFNSYQSMNKSYEFRTIYLSSIIIQLFFINNNNNVFVCLFNQKGGFFPTKLFLLHLYISYKNIYLKLSKNLENNENLFNLIFKEIFLIPLIHNFDNVYQKLRQKIDLILFGNSEFITSFMVDLETNEIIGDIGNLTQKNYKSSFLQLKNKKKILDEIIFHGINLKNNYIKSNDKKIDKIENNIKLELRATFPKPLFFIKFIPILRGVAIIHYFNQYKLSKSQIRNPNNPNSFIYDKYKEIDVVYFNLYDQLEGNNIEKIKNIESFFFEYFLILGNNCKETGNVSQNLMTYKSKDYNLIYLNNNILQLIKEVIMEYFKDEKDLIFKLKKKLSEENEKLEANKYELIQEGSIDMNNNNYYNYINFIKEFKSNLLQNKKTVSEFVEVNDIKIIMKGDLSNMSEHSKLNLTKDNIGIIKRNIISTDNNEFNVYNNYGIISTDNKNQKTEIENEDIPSNTNEPFNIDITNIVNNIEVSKDEWGLKSILVDKNKQK